MAGFNKLALIAAGILAGLAIDAQAAIFLPSQFVYYNRNSSSLGAQRTVGFNYFFVRIRGNNPTFNVANIQWVERHTTTASTISLPPGTIDTIPPWENKSGTQGTYQTSATIPEPTSLALVAGVVGVIALRRRNAKV